MARCSLQVPARVIRTDIVDEQYVGRPIRELPPPARDVEIVGVSAPVTARLAVHNRGKIYIVRIADIDWIETAGNYVRIHTAGTAHLYRDSLRNFESRLDAARFVRIHRSVIVNIDRVTHLEPSFRGEHVVTLRDRTRLTMTAPYRGRMEAVVGRF